MHKHALSRYKRAVHELSLQSHLLLRLHNLFRLGGAFKALGGDGCLMRHALPHDVTFSPQDDFLQ